VISEEIPHSESLLLIGSHGNADIGILILHGFTGSPASISPWAKAFHERGFTVSAPRLAGHGTRWQDLNRTSWNDWYESAERALRDLHARCSRIFIAGFSVGGALALRLVQSAENIQQSSAIEGVLLLNPSIFDERKIYHLLPLLSKIIPSVKSGESDVAKPNPPRHGYSRIPLRALNSLRKLWRIVENDLCLVEKPIWVGYSTNDHVVDPSCSLTIMENVSSRFIRETIFERSFHNVALDYDAENLFNESAQFIADVLAGYADGLGDEQELINAEFESIVSVLSLDESAPTTYLDELERASLVEEHFDAPDPQNPRLSRSQKLIVGGLVGGPTYLLIQAFTSFDPLGLGPWPGLLAFIAASVAAIWRTARGGEDYDDGAVL
jgi:carboxylesterase